MWSNKPNEMPLQNPRSSQNRDSIRDLTTAWDAFSQTKAALQHIENKLEVAPTSTAVLDSVMDSKKPSAGTTRKISRKASRSSSQKKERSPRCPLRVTTLDSNVRKSGHVEFCEPLVSFRDAAWSPSYKTSCQPESRCLKLKDAGSIKKTEGMSSMAYGKGEQSRDFKSPSSADETVVRYLNDRPAIDALQSSDVFFEAVTPTRSEEEKTEGSRGDEYIKTSLSTTTQDTELKELQLVESSASSASTSSAHRLDILRNRQHDAKLEKLKERIRKQWEYPEELSSRGHRLEYADHPILVAAPENAVTPKVRKVATAPPGPSYKGFNSSEAKIRTPDGKVWREEEFLNLSRELCRDLELQLAEEDMKDWKEAPPAKTKERKAVRTVRKIQKVAHLPNPDSKPGYTNAISTSSWRDGQRLAKKLLGPTPKVEQQDKQPVSSDRIGKDRATKPGSHTGKAESDFKLDVTIKTIARSPERSRSKVRVENNTKKKDSTVQDAKLGEDHVNKDFLPVEIRGILDDLQLDSVSQGTVQERNEESQQPKLATSAFTRSHSPTKRKPDGLSANEEPQVTSKKRHYDTDEVRQYIARQQEERKKRQNEEKKAQKEATEQKNKRLQELYKKQREALAHKAKSTPAPESATKQLQATYSKLLLERTLLEEPKPPVQEFKPGYQPSGESDKENKVQERPPSASSSSDMSLSEPPHPLLGNNMLEPLWIQPDRLGSKAQLPSSQPSVMNGGLFSQLLSLDHMGVLQTDFDSVLSTRKSHSTAAGSMPLASQSFITSAVQPTINQYKSKLDRIEALKATAASLSSRIESEAKKLAGAGINHGALWNSEHNLLQGDQGDGNWAKACSSPVREDDVFSARLQKMLGTCISHTSFDDSLPGVGNLSEFKKLPDSLSPHTAAISLPGSHRPEGMPGNLTKKQTGSPVGESRAAFLQNGSVGSISEGPLSDGLLSEEEEERHEYPPLKMVEVFKEKEFCVANKTICEPIKEFQKEAEKFLPIFTQIRTAPKPWEDLCKGSPHSVINIFTKSYQLYGKGFEEWSGQGLTTQRPLLPVMSPSAGIVSYEDDFISSQGSGTATDKKTAPEPSNSSSPSLKEELASRKSPYEFQAVDFTHYSSGPPSASSSRSSASSKKRGEKEKLESFSGVPSAPLWEESKPSPEADYGQQQAKNPLPNSSAFNREEQNPDSDSTLEELSGHSLMSLPEKLRSPRTASSPQSPSIQKQSEPVVNTAEKNTSPSSPVTVAPGPKPSTAFSDMNLGTSRMGVGTLSGSMRFSPSGLQHRMSAELNYLSAIEESMRQISDVERIRSISLAQQESVSLAQMLKAQQQRHERNLALLRLKAEQEALESQRQLEEARQKAAQAHAESQQQLVQSQQEAAEALQEATCKMAAQQVEAALLTTDAARAIREMTELARTQISDAINVPSAPVTTLFDQERKHHSAFIKQLQAHNMNRKSESVTPSQSKEETGDSKHNYSPSFDSYSESSRSKAHDQSSSSSSNSSSGSRRRSHQESPSVPSSKETKKHSRREKPSTSIEEEAPVAVNDSLQSNSIPSIPDERDSASVATEYSLKFDESMTEDEIEEKSFRSLLPSESHRLFNLKKRDHRDYSDEEASPGKTTLSPVKNFCGTASKGLSPRTLKRQVLVLKSILGCKELSLPFSGGQDSFSKFTMEMVRQYMKEEEMRAAHHSSLLRLREKALKEKTKAELAWLEHQKKRLRDKGEDDKMPPIRKKQRGLLLKLQQEKAEIKRLQEANKAARKERQLILKQQEEIERIRQTTMKLQEKLKSAGENKLEHRSEDDAKQTHSSSPLPTDAETCSPSSISSCETSSIMQKLKKMRSRMDEKHCSPVHYFFSVFTSHHWASLSVCFPNLHPKFQLYIYNQLVRFLTKREQKLMQRRQHAEELLQWKRRLDAEEAEIRQIEKQALAAWDKELLKVKGNKKGSGDQKSDQKETASEEESSVPACSRLNSESSIPEDLGSLAVESGLPKVSEAQEQFGSLDHTLTEEMVYAQERGSAASPGKHSPSKSSVSLTKQGSHRAGGKQHACTKSQDALSYSWSDESLSMTQSETTSDQSDIESRIRALKDELRKRKSVVYQLKKEQKKRHKERLKAQEASLIKQLETYDEFIKKTEAELSRDLEATPTAKPQIKTPSSATEKPKIKPPPLHRSETSKSWKSLPDSERSRGSLQSIAEHVDAVSHSEKSLSAYTRKLIEAEIQTEEQSHIPSLLFKVPKKFRAESGDSLDNLASSALFKDLGDTSKTSHVSLNKSEDTTSCDSLVSTNKSVVQEEVESAKSEEYEAKVAHGASEKSDDSAFNIEQKHSPSATLKSDKLLEKKQVGLPFPQERKMAGECFDEDTVSLKFSQKLSKELQKGDFLASEQISICKEPFYSNSFEESSSREERSKNGTPFTDYCKDDFEAPALSVGKDNRPHGEKSWCTKTPRSRSASIGSDDEISECLSEKSLSVAGSIHSERLLELKSPTELMKSEERSDVEKERANVDLSLWASSSKAEEEEENALLDFKIGERVLVSNVQPGILRFKGLTSFAKGFWAGVELDKPEGNNNGAYNGIQYFSCKEKHGIFAPPHKISHISESFDNYVDLNKDLLCKDEPAHHQKDRESAEEDESKKRNASEKCSQDKFPGGTSALEGSHSAEGFIKIMSQRNHEPLVTVASEEFDQETSIADSLKSSVDDSCIISASVSNACREASAIAVGGTLESSFPEKWKQQPPSWQEYTEKSDSLSPGVLEKSATPLLDLLTKERSQLEAQLRVPSQEKEELVNQQEKVGLLAESLLQTFVKDTVNQLQQIKKVRNEKIQFSNQELYAIQERSATSDLQNILISSELDDGEEVSSPDMCPRPESPVFGASGQEELAKRLAELELSREFLSALGDDQDWFDEDFGLSSRKVPQEQAEESAVLPKTELPKVLPKPCEEPLAVPHTAGAVEDLVRAAAEELWKCKELGQGLQISSLPSDIHEPPVDDGIEAVSKHIYKQAVFDLTREIFGEIFAEDPNLNQPIWMKPCRITSGYFRRVKDPNDLEEIKSFITVEVLKLLNLKKEPNNKTDWQKMMKFGRKKRDRVDHILVQELHEEEAQWVNYDEDELQVKMQLADGIFEALIRETIDLLNQINKKQEKLVPL
ncbi:centrosome-associated protein 350 isoform X2 [Varanus komodoensis]|uniref:centrosome-associated protein 350 isoform X2 n=1 Tax=Varanus komodoensis TaxID=61221 RepID=UPI001CF78A9C|nr:centrosome-associated protein 350 isoform X2 [Varanus komodoensis]